MKKTLLASAMLLGAAITSGAWAQDSANPAADSEAELNIIMSVVDEDDTPDDVINRIKLPPAPEAVVELPDVELPEPPLDRAVDVLEHTSRGAAITVTESVNDALSIGDLENLPEDITGVLPEEVIEEVINGTVDDIDDADELIDEAANKTMGTGAILDELKAISKMAGTVEELLGDVGNNAGGSL